MNKLTKIEIELLISLNTDLIKELNGKSLPGIESLEIINVKLNGLIQEKNSRIGRIVKFKEFGIYRKGKIINETEEGNRNFWFDIECSTGKLFSVPICDIIDINFNK